MSYRSAARCRTSPASSPRTMTWNLSPLRRLISAVSSPPVTLSNSAVANPGLLRTSNRALPASSETVKRSGHHVLDIAYRIDCRPLRQARLGEDRYTDDLDETDCPRHHDETRTGPHRLAEHSKIRMTRAHRRRIPRAGTEMDQSQDAIAALRTHRTPQAAE